MGASIRRVPNDLSACYALGLSLQEQLRRHSLLRRHRYHVQYAIGMVSGSFAGACGRLAEEIFISDDAFHTSDLELFGYVTPQHHGVCREVG